MVIILTVMYPVVTAIVMTAFAFLYNPWSDKWLAGMFVIPVGFAIEIATLKSCIFSTAVFTAMAITLMPRALVGKFLHRLLLAWIITSGVVVAVVFCLGGNHLDSVAVLFVLSAIITGWFLPSRSVRALFDPQVEGMDLEVE